MKLRFYLLGLALLIALPALFSFGWSSRKTIVRKTVVYGLSPKSTAEAYLAARYRGLETPIQKLSCTTYTIGVNRVAVACKVTTSYGVDKVVIEETKSSWQITPTS